MKQDTAKEIIDEAHRSGDPAFRKFADSYGSGSRGNGLEELVISLYEYAIASPQPEQWLRNCVSAYEMPEDGTWVGFFRK